MSGVFSPTRAKIKERTLRTDKWWLEPLLTFSVLISFVIYATFRAFENKYYFVKESHLISPFYSPCLSDSCDPGATIANFTPVSSQIFNFALSPALIILIFPLGFRMTCYYYRKSYYRSFWMSPPACAVAEPHKTYTGETRFPLIIQNSHRYFFYAGLVLNIILPKCGRRMGPHECWFTCIDSQCCDVVVVLDVMSHLPSHNWWSTKEFL
jgi:hypothetical protein